MPLITFDGKTHRIPDVYHKEEVVQQGAGPLPNFLIPVVLAAADEGYPYNVNSLLYSEEGSRSEFTLIGTSSAAGTEFGPESDMAKAFAMASKHGLPQAYCCAMNALTRTTVVATSTGPVNEATVYSRKFGFPGAFIKLKNTAGALVITPVKRYTRLTVDGASGDSVIYVKDHSWMSEGSSYEIGDINTTNATITVDKLGEDFDSAGQKRKWVRLTAALAATFAQTDYACVVEYDTNNQEESGALADGTAMIQWLQDESALLSAREEGTFANAVWINVATDTPLKDIAAWGTVTAGASPDPIAGDYTAWVTLMDDSAWDAFLSKYQVVPQAFLVVDPSSTIHATMRDFAIQKRGTEGTPISITTGVDWNEYDLSVGTDANPNVRTAALNSQDVTLCGPGLDYEAPYLTLAPAIFGLRVGAGINHNLTSDDLIYSAVEYDWKERTAGELTSVLNGGLCTYSLKVHDSIRHRVTQGLNTLQSNDQSWNPVTNDTGLIMQRDLADFVTFTLSRDLTQYAVGADGIEADAVRGLCTRRARQLEQRGYILAGWSITSVTKNATGAGWDVVWALRLPTTTDYITLTTQIIVGSDE